MRFARNSTASGLSVSRESGGAFWSSLELLCEDYRPREQTIDSVRASAQARRDRIPGLTCRGIAAVMMLDDLRVPREFVLEVCEYSSELELLRSVQRTRALIHSHSGAAC